MRWPRARRATPPAPSPTLREAQAALRDALAATASDAGTDVAAAAWIDGADRITDSVNTLAHLLQRDAARGNR